VLVDPHLARGLGGLFFSFRPRTFQSKGVDRRVVEKRQARKEGTSGKKGKGLSRTRGMSFH